MYEDLVWLILFSFTEKSGRSVSFLVMSLRDAMPIWLQLAPLISNGLFLVKAAGHRSI